MATRTTALTTCLLFCAFILLGEEKLGINTTAPFRSLEVYGHSGQFIRVQSSSNFGGGAGIEFLRGLSGVSATDWRIINDGGALRFQYSEDNFSTAAQEAMRISPAGNTGIGTNIPSSSMHIDGGNQLAFGGTGYLKIGTTTSFNLAFDNTQIQALNNDQPASLTFQNEGGNTYICSSGGNTYMGSGDGVVGVGTAANTAKLMLQDEDFQLYLQNSSDGINGWHIGASKGSWVSGDNQLIFSPTGSSSDAVLRLHNVTENTGTQAPVMLYNSYNYTMLMDGNEIDTRGTPLYINHNSGEETYINPTGGWVGLKRDLQTWWISPSPNGDLQFYKNTSLLAYVDLSGGGTWVAVSDERLKEQAQPLNSVLERIQELEIYSYDMIPALGGFHDIGVIAQDLESLFPEAGSNTNGQYGVCYDQLTVIGIKGIQEQQMQLEQLHAKVDGLLAKIQ